MPPSFAHLHQRHIVRLSGAGRFTFLQSALTCNIHPVEKNNAAIYGFLLSPQGKIACDMHIVPMEDELLLDIGAENIAAVFAALRMAGLGRDIVLELAGHLGVYALFGSEDAIASQADKDEQTARDYPRATASPSPVHKTAGGAYYDDSRDQRLGGRFIGTAEQARMFARMSGVALDENTAGYQRARIYCGVWEAPTDIPPSGLFPPDIGADQYGALSLRKGCYIGQEVISRIVHKSTRKKRRAVLTCPDAEAFASVAPFTTLTDEDGAAAGILLSSSGNAALACLKDGDKSDMTLSCASIDGDICSPIHIHAVFHPVS